MTISKCYAKLNELVNHSAKISKELFAKIDNAGLFKGRGFSLREGQILTFPAISEMLIYWTEMEKTAMLSTIVTSEYAGVKREEEFPCYALRKCVTQDAPDYASFMELVDKDPLLYDLTKGEVNDLTNLQLMAGLTFKVHVHEFTNRRKDKDIPGYKVYTFEKVKTSSRKRA